MNKRPLVGMFLMTLIGELVSKESVFIWTLFFVLAICYVFISYYWKTIRIKKRTFLLLLVGYCMGFLCSRQYETWKEESLNRCWSSIEENILIEAEGIVIEVDETEKYSSIHITSCRLFRQDVSWSSPDLIIFQWKKQNTANRSRRIMPGDIVRAKGMVELLSHQRNDGGYDEETILSAQGIVARLKSENVDILEKFTETTVFSIIKTSVQCYIRRELYEIRMALKASYDRLVAPKQAGVLQAMCLGFKSEVDEQVRTQFEYAGIIHILAISGVHISIVGMSLFAGLRKRGITVLFSSVVALAVNAVFVGMTGGSISAKRAYLMFAITLGGAFLGRCYDGLNAMALSGSILLWMHPYFLDSVSFQYSFVAISAVYMGQEMIKRCYKRLHPIGKACFIGLFLSLCTMPITAWYNGQIPIASFLINLFVIPIVSPILLSGLLGGILDGMVVVFLKHTLSIHWLEEGIRLLAGWIIWIAENGIKWICYLATCYKECPYGIIITGRPPRSIMVLCYVMLLICVRLVIKRRKMILLCLMLPVIVVMFAAKGRYEDQMVFLDVGQGDGIYMEWQEGLTMMVDGGSSNVGRIGKYVLKPFLSNHGRGRIDIWFVSHCDDDHISGLLELLEEGYPIKTLVFAEDTERNAAYEKLCALARNNNTKIQLAKSGERLETEGMRIEILGNEKETIMASDSNNRSMILLVTSKRSKKTALLTGDIDAEREKQLIGELTELVDGELYLLKSSHHGSKNSNSKEFLEALKPQHIVISYGENNRYGHPHKEAIERMKEIGAQLYRTAVNGQITFRLS